MTDSYAGTRGHSGGDASKDAAVAERDSGKTSEMMDRVLAQLARAGERGATIIDLRESWELEDEHHGRISSALTKLHIAGKVSALRERRDNCGVYVPVGFENGREVRPYRRQNVKLRVEDVQSELQRHRVGETQGYLLVCICKGWQEYTQLSYERHVAEQIVALSRGEV